MKIKYSNEDEMLNIMKHSIGGTDISAIANVNPYRSPLDTYYDKINPTIQSVDNNFMWWGRELEPLVAKRFSMLTGMKVQNDNHIIIDDECEFFHANIDRKIVGENAILECKTTNSMNSAEWEGEHIPDVYLCQLQWYLGITKTDKAYIACLLGDKNLIWKVCYRNEDMIKQLREIGYNFWTECVQKQQPPLANHNDANTIFSVFGIDNDNEFDGDNCYDLVENYLSYENKEKDLKEQIKSVTQMKDTYANQIKQLMEGKTKGYCNIYTINNKISETTTVDSKLLKEKYPDIYKECSKQSFRKTFNIKITK